MELKLHDTESNHASVIANLRKILLMKTETPEEKFKVLDARDKLYKIMRDKDPAVKRGALIATCPDMCPEKERLLRDYQGRGSIFEMTDFLKNSSFNHSLAVKEYARSSADQEEPLPHDLRPVHILTMTMSHLLHNIADHCELSDENLEEWYMFMWDRTRALRKELTQQGNYNFESVTLVEQCARFHIHCAERLIDQDSSIYDDKINTENLTKCLQTLKYMYKDLAQEDIKCPNEAEFICYTLLLNLNNSSVFTELSNMPSFLMTTEPVKFALEIMTAWEMRNFIKFFNLVKKTTYLNCCLLRRYFGEMRLYAIKTMIHAYCTKTYSPQIVLSWFIQNLNFEGEEECLNFLTQCNFNFHKINGKTVVNFDRILFKNPQTTLSSGRAYLFIEGKKERPLSVIMAGGNLPPKLFENYVPQNSFMENGILNPNTLPKNELFDLSSATSVSFKGGNSVSKPDSNKTKNIILKEDQEDLSVESKLKTKLDTASFSNVNLFPSRDVHLVSSQIFGSFQTPYENFSKTSQNRSMEQSIFKPRQTNQYTETRFENQSFSVLNNNAANNFQPQPTSFADLKFPSLPSKEITKEPPLFSFFPNKKNNIFSTFGDSSHLMTNFDDAKTKNQLKLNAEKLYEDSQTEKGKQLEEKNTKLIVEAKKSSEENDRKEIEIKEKKKLEEDMQKKKEFERLEKMEKAWQDKLREENEKQLEELKRQEEEKRRIELEYKRKVDAKISHLKIKLGNWKTKIIFEKWRMITWAKIEERRMNEYFKEVKVKYPPVCSEESLGGNPYGLLIPSILTLEKFRNWRKEPSEESSKKLLIVNQGLPLLKVDYILRKPLENFAKSLKVKFSNPFPWKLVISIPDKSESPDYWKSIETFVEMHFADNFQWQFGVQKGPLYCGSSGQGSFQYKISVRRLRGTEMYEGMDVNPSATTGSNALIFFVTENGNKLTRDRLKKVITSRALLPKIPVIVVALNSRFNESDLKTFLDLEALQKSHISSFHIIPIVEGKHQLVEEFIKCLKLATTYSAPPSHLRISQISSFFTTTWLDFIWRRTEISLSNFKLTLESPKVLIEFYNSCLDALLEMFLDPSYDEQTVLGEEFSEFGDNKPERTESYIENLNIILNKLKLPHWPREIPKSSHQLNYRIHQYCKKIVDNNKINLKNLKWRLFNIIKRFLLWKGLDIYCDEDIGQILINFPWVQIFQEISNFKIRQLITSLEKEKDLRVIYDSEKIEQINFEPSLIAKVSKKSKRHSSKKHSSSTDEEWNPRMENDSIIYAYSAAVKTYSNKRKREECINESLEELFSDTNKKRLYSEEKESKNFELAAINFNFQNLDDQINKIKEQISENSKTLKDILSEIQ